MENKKPSPSGSDPFAQAKARLDDIDPDQIADAVEAELAVLSGGTKPTRREALKKFFAKWKGLLGVLITTAIFVSGLGGKVQDYLTSRVQKQVASLQERERVQSLSAGQEQILKELLKMNQAEVELQKVAALLEKDVKQVREQFEAINKRLDALEADNVTGKEERLILRGQVTQIERSDAVQTQIITATLSNLVKPQGGVR